jgi:hypothetical protein
MLVPTHSMLAGAAHAVMLALHAVLTLHAVLVTAHRVLALHCMALHTVLVRRAMGLLGRGTETAVLAAECGARGCTGASLLSEPLAEPCEHLAKIGAGAMELVLLGAAAATLAELGAKLSDFLTKFLDLRFNASRGTGLRATGARTRFQPTCRGAARLGFRPGIGAGLRRAGSTLTDTALAETTLTTEDALATETALPAGTEVSALRTVLRRSGLLYMPRACFTGVRARLCPWGTFMPMARTVLSGLSRRGRRPVIICPHYGRPGQHPNGTGRQEHK